MLKRIYNRLLSGDCSISYEEVQSMNQAAMDILNKEESQAKGFLPPDMIEIVIDLIKISNLLYNNNANGYLPLNDDIYDRLVVLCKRYNVVPPVGAPPVVFHNIENVIENTKYESSPNEKKEVIRFVPGKDQMIFFPDLSHTIPPIPEDFIINKDNGIVGKISRNSAHNYGMCGTLDKCKYVLDFDAKREGVYESNSVNIFERDFLAKHIAQGIIDPNNIDLVVSLKYDGISVENSMMGPVIQSSCSRGDTYNNESSDLTPILGGMVFHRASNIEPKEFGIKFEYIITNENLARIQRDFGIKYVNRRNAVIGIFTRLDARNLRDYLTPVPIESSLDIDRIDEIEFLNKYYTKGEILRYTEIKGSYDQVMYLLSTFVSEAEKVRDFMPFAYDGVVVEYRDKSIRERLGKLNAIPRYAIAIKFNPMKRKSVFTHYTYSVGQTGVITPMAHFKPVEFMGAYHDKTTIHSLARFNKLKLRPGDIVNLTLMNDVIVYLTKAPDEEQGTNNNPYEEFPTHCPCCGQPLYTSDSGEEKNAYCINFMCPERCVVRLSNMLAKLNVKGYSDQTIRILGFNNFKDLIHTNQDYLHDKLGLNGDHLYNDLLKLKNANYPDYRLIGSIGFTGIAIAKWKLILQNISIERLLTCTDEELQPLTAITGIGNKILETIIKERKFFMNDLMEIFNTFKFQHTELGSNDEKPVVIFTGFRDDTLANLFMEKGFEVKETSPNKKTFMLVVPYIGFQSGKVNKIFDILGSKIGARNNQPKYIIDYSNYSQFDIAPYLMDFNQALEFIKNYNPEN